MSLAWSLVEVITWIQSGTVKENSQLKAAADSEDSLRENSARERTEERCERQTTHGFLDFTRYAKA